MEACRLIDPRVIALCEEIGIECIEGTGYPRLGQTRAHRTILKLIKTHGEDHARMVLITLFDTQNNKACLDAPCIFATSDLVKKFKTEIDKDASKWLALFDRLPVAYLQHIAAGARDFAEQRKFLFSTLFERLMREYGNQELFEG